MIGKSHLARHLLSPTIHSLLPSLPLKDKNQISLTNPMHGQIGTKIPLECVLIERILLLCALLNLISLYQFFIRLIKSID